MLIRLLNTQMMTTLVYKILRWYSKRLLRKPQKMLGGYFILPHPVYVAAQMSLNATRDINDCRSLGHAMNSFVLNYLLVYMFEKILQW